MMQEFESALCFLNFLRGMETDVRQFFEVAHSRFLNFLRGMETPGAGAEARRPACFLNFLRGMETHSMPRSSHICRSLPKLP